MKEKQLRIIIFLITILFLFSFSLAEKNIGLTIEQILELPEDEIDLGIACLVITEEICPDIDIDYFSKQLDIMARQIEYILQGETKPLARIGAMNTFLYRAGW
jgi:hypothetical protein